jgi:transposase-like protein
VIDYQTFCHLRQLRDRDGLNAAQIARELGLHPQTVSLWIDRTTYDRRKAPPRSSKLDPFKPTISRLLDRRDYSANQILALLKEEGYTGGATILREHVARVRPRHRQAFLKLRFAPGQTAQVDWGSAGVIQVGNTRCQLSFFVMVLCFSRRMYLEFTLRQSQEHFLSAHHNAFVFFGGVPSEVIVDYVPRHIIDHDGGGNAPEGSEGVFEAPDEVLGRLPRGGLGVALAGVAQDSAKQMRAAPFALHEDPSSLPEVDLELVSRGALHGVPATNLKNVSLRYYTRDARITRGIDHEINVAGLVKS